MNSTNCTFDVCGAFGRIEGKRGRGERSLAFTRDFLLEEYLFNFPAVKPGAGGGPGRKGERAGTRWGKGKAISRPSAAIQRSGRDRGGGEGRKGCWSLGAQSRDKR